MNDDLYRAEVLAAYEGELGGEIASAVLMDHLAAEGTRAVKLDLMRRLEARVGAALAPIVARLGAAPADPDGLAMQARGRALAIGSWDELIDQFGPRLDAYVARFEALRAAARPGDEAALTLLVAHERALVDFGQRESAGDGAGALACLREAIGFDHIGSPADQQSSVAVRSQSLRWPV